MSQIEAVYRHGVFEPLEPVNLREEQRVQLSIELTDQDAIQTWLGRVQTLQAGLVKRRGLLPDSTPDIAGDRMR